MALSFSKLTDSSLKQCVVQELENKILSGELKPGDRLPPERELASAMGISRSLVNLCILDLDSKGFVSINPRKGTFVNDFRRQGTLQILLSLMNYNSDRMDLELFDNMMDTRRLIEYECTRLAVQNAADRDLQKIGDAFHTMTEREDMQGFVNGNFSFHHALASASGNAVYAMIFNSFKPAIHCFLRLYFSAGNRRDASVEHHRELLDALMKRDEAAALEAIGRTLDMGISGLERIYKREIG